MLTITTHAIQRYRERVNPLATTEEIRRKLNSRKLHLMHKALGDGGVYPTGECRVYIKNNVIVTVLPIEGRHKVRAE